MSLPRHIFRAYDIRGVYGKDLTPEAFLRVGAALARWSDRFFVCSDTRLSSPPLRLALSAGLLGAGASVVDAGEGPIGLAIYASKHLRYSVGYVTASHLPYEWNGLKLYYPGGVPISLEKLEELWRQASGTLSWKASREARYERASYLESYMEFLRRLPRESGGLKVVVDCGNGAASLVVPELLRELGYQVVAVNCDVDPVFSVRGSEPTPEATSYLGDLVQKFGGDLGVAFDGDGDRVIFYDEKGRALAPEQVAVVMINGHRVKKVVANVECSSLIDRYVEGIGGSVERVPVGRIYIIYKSLDGVEGLGVESSGHFVTYSGANLDDGIASLLYLLEALRKLGGKLSSHVPPMPLSKRLKFEVGDERKFEIVEKLKESLASRYEKVVTVDGVRVDLSEGWFLVRPSNTEPVIRVTLEAESEESLRAMESLVLEELRRAGLSSV
jgi:phosphomannomutase